MKNNILEKVKQRVHKLLISESSGHGYDHIIRVYRTSIKITKTEKADLFITSLAALLHDVGDYKLMSDKKEHHREMILKTTQGLNIEENIIEKVIQIAERISFKGAKLADKDMSIEGKIVRDADRLDAIGAIGIARAFAYGGNHQRPLYNAEEKPQHHNSFNAYKSSQSSTINHFYEKLFHLKERMETDTAKIMAAERHEIMKDFVSNFLDEWGEG